MTPAQKLDALKRLMADSGWGVIDQQIREEILATAIKMSDPTTRMTTDDIHFYRGLIHSANLLRSVPQRMAQKLTTDLMIEAAKDAAKKPKPDPAPAG